MTLTGLIVIISETDGNGKKIFKRLDNKFVSSDYIDVLKEPPIILQLTPHEKLKPIIDISGYFVKGANALLIGEMIGEQDDDYYAATFCRLRNP